MMKKLKQTYVNGTIWYGKESKIFLFVETSLIRNVKEEKIVRGDDYRVNHPTYAVEFYFPECVVGWEMAHHTYDVAYFATEEDKVKFEMQYR